MQLCDMSRNTFNWSSLVRNYYLDKLSSVGLLIEIVYQKTKQSINEIDAEVYLITKMYIHVKHILFWKTKEATLHNLFKNIKK